MREGVALQSNKKKQAKGPNSIAEDLDLLDRKLKQLKNEYDQYFLGSRNREPHLLRGEVQKLVGYYANTSIRNTALRFRFNNLCARYFAHRRHWDAILRQIEDGTYERHVFKANLREREAAGSAEGGGRRAAGPDADELFEAYVAARRSCGEAVKGLSPERMNQLLARQRKEIQQRYGCDDVRFRVVVEKGRAKLKASPVGRKRTPPA